MRPFGRAEGLRFVLTLSRCALIGAAFCATLGALAHLASAAFAPDLYSIALGDGLLPPSPVDSWIWGPILIGAFVTWWPDFVRAGLGGLAAGAAVLALLMFLENRRYPVHQDGWGNVLAESVIQEGYWALVTALIALTSNLAFKRRRNPGTVKEG
jgi:hypothetical protein